MSQALTVNLPGDLSVHIKNRATTHRSMEDEAVELLAAALPAD